MTGPARSPRLLYSELMPTLLTRREWTLLAAASGAVAQSPSAPRAEGESESEAAHRLIEHNARALDAVHLPFSTEPAFVFRP